MPRKTIANLERQIKELRGLRESDAIWIKTLKADKEIVIERQKLWEDRAIRAEKEAQWLRALIQHTIEIAKVRS